MESASILEPTSVTEQAQKWAQHRFRFADSAHPVVVWLKELTADRLEKAMICGVVNSIPRPEAGELPHLSCCNIVDLSLDENNSFMDKIKLPSMPQVFFQLQQLMNDPSASADDMARVISLDPKLTSSLLRLVNSAIFKFRYPVDTVSRAVAVVGMRQISTLALGTLMLGLFKERPPRGVDMDKFWRHSIATGMAARQLATMCGRRNVERYFVAGLLHDMGWLAMCCYDSERMQQVLQRALEMDNPFTEVERRMLGFDHAIMGAKLFSQWQIPANLVSAVRYHHEPFAAEEHDEAIFVHVADALVKGLDFGLLGGQHAFSIDVNAWDALGIDSEKLGTVVELLEDELEVTVEALMKS